MDKRFMLHTEEEELKNEEHFAAAELAEELRLGIEELFECEIQKTGAGFRMIFANGGMYSVAVTEEA